VDAKLYQATVYILIGIALFYAAAAGSDVFLVVAAIISTYYVYSAPPLRFKRVPIFSKIVIAFNSFALTALGFLLIQGSFSQFPVALGWIYLLGFTLAANFIDLKDIKGDKANGIKTLPLLIGERPAKLLIGSSLFFIALAFYFVFTNPLPWYCYAGSAVLYFYLINKSNYRDRHVLQLMDINYCMMIIYLLAF
jgi:4-hydroxybenzoate polyprenyltransferase